MYEPLNTRKFKSLEDWHPLYKHAGIHFSAENEWGIPDLPAYKGIIPKRLVGYASLGRMKEDQDIYLGEAAVHCYMQDFKFETVWTKPGVGLEKVLRTDLAISPDFSVYEDFPLPLQYYNKFRSHWVARLWAAEGVAVIPNVTWAGEASYDMMFSGIPTDSIVAVASLGALRDAEDKKYFKEAYSIMLERLRPTDVIFYGNLPKGLEQGGYNLHHYKNVWASYTEKGEIN